MGAHVRFREQTGNWIVEYDGERTEPIGTRKTGRMKKITKGGFETKKAATDWMAQMLVDTKNGLHVPASKSTTVKEAADAWIAHGKAMKLERTSLNEMERHVRLHIAPRLGTIKLNELNVATVRNWQEKLRAGDDGMSLALCRKVTTSLSSIITNAMGSGKVGHNVVDNAPALKSSQEERAEPIKEEKDYPSHAQVDKLLAIAMDNSSRTESLMRVALFCGLRVSELRGLYWSDIDLKSATLTVQRRADRYGVIGRPKSKAAYRTLHLGDKAVKALRRWQVACPPGDLIFPGADGRPIHYNTLMNFTVVPAWKKAGIKAPFVAHAHSLRHYCISNWLVQIPSIPKVSKLAGHANTKLTTDTYGHLLTDKGDAAMFAALER